MWRSILDGLKNALIVVALGYLSSWLKAQADKIRQDDLRRAANEAVDILVRAAEQLFIGAGRGAEKMAYVLEGLRERGLDGVVGEAEIEAKVGTLFPNYEPDPEPDDEADEAADAGDEA